MFKDVNNIINKLDFIKRIFLSGDSIIIIYQDNSSETYCYDYMEDRNKVIKQLKDCLFKEVLMFNNKDFWESKHKDNDKEWLSASSLIET